MISDRLGPIYDFLLIWHACCSCFEKRFQPCKPKLKKLKWTCLLREVRHVQPVLIVDDEVTTRNLCRDVAVDAGLQVYVAPTTEEALEILDQYPGRHRGHGSASAATGRPGAIEANPRQ